MTNFGRGVFLEGPDTPTARGLYGCPRGSPFTILDVPFQIWRDNTYREGAGSQRSTILRVSFYLRVHPLSQCYQIWRGGGACILESATPPVPSERSFCAPQFRVLLYSSYILYRITTKFGLAMRSASVKKLFYYYGVYTGCCVSFNTVLSKLKCALVV